MTSEIDRRNAEYASLRLRLLVIGLAFGLPAPMAVAAPPAPPPHSQTEDRPDVRHLRLRIKALLKDGRIDDAVRIAQDALEKAPDDAAIRHEFVDLHIALARNWIAQERFTDALAALDAVIRVQPGQLDATRLKQSIDAARRAVPARVQQAREWIELEWYEPAFNAFRQAVALSPAHRRDWLKGYHDAAVGAGDDDYLTKNFQQAFYYYDAAMKLGDEADIPPDPALVSRWLQCLVHSLDDDSGPRYPAAYWRLIFQRIADADYHGPDAGALKATLEGIAYEHAGNARQAARAFARALAPSARRATSGAAAGHRAAVAQIRKLYDPASTGRRRGEWQRSDTDAPQLLESPRFRVHHHNGVIAQRVARALDFHFERIADSWALDANEIPWEKKADIYLYPDLDAFYKATGQAPPVTAISHIRLKGSQVAKKEIHAHLADPMLLSASLAHELTHLMTAELRRDRPLPAVLTEGLALCAEPQCRQRQFARLFESQKRPATIKRLLKFTDVHPTNVSFYCEAHRLMAVLLSRANPADILELRGEDIDVKRLARRCGFANWQQLQRRYNRLSLDEDRNRGGDQFDVSGETN